MSAFSVGKRGARVFPPRSSRGRRMGISVSVCSDQLTVSSEGSIPQEQGWLKFCTSAHPPGPDAPNTPQVGSLWCASVVIVSMAASYPYDAPDTFKDFPRIKSFILYNQASSVTIPLLQTRNLGPGKVESLAPGPSVWTWWSFAWSPDCLVSKPQLDHLTLLYVS